MPAPMGRIDPLDLRTSVRTGDAGDVSDPGKSKVECLQIVSTTLSLPIYCRHADCLFQEIHRYKIRTPAQYRRDHEPMWRSLRDREIEGRMCALFFFPPDHTRALKAWGPSESWPDVIMIIKLIKSSSWNNWTLTARWIFAAHLLHFTHNYFLK